MFVKTAKIKFRKTFVSGLLNGLDYDDQISYPASEIKRHLAHYNLLKESQQVVRGSGSAYIITHVELA